VFACVRDSGMQNRNTDEESPDTDHVADQSRESRDLDISWLLMRDEM
jgi:hypothetical protein